MEVNLLLSIILPILFTILILEFDEAMMLFLLGFIGIIVTWNFALIFSITSTSYAGFGVMLQIVWMMVTLFAFIRSYFTRESKHYSAFFGKIRG